MEVVEQYLELCLRLGRHIDGLVDAYYGPDEIARRVEAEELRDPAALVQDAGSLLASVDDGWLGAQLVGLETVARKLAGEEVAYEDEVERCYGVRPEWTRNRSRPLTVSSTKSFRAMARSPSATRHGARARRCTGIRSRPSSTPSPRTSVHEPRRSSSYRRASPSWSTTSPTSPGRRSTTTRAA